jgi:hypothetical protein
MHVALHVAHGTCTRHAPTRNATHQTAPRHATPRTHAHALSFFRFYQKQILIYVSFLVCTHRSWRRTEDKARKTRRLKSVWRERKRLPRNAPHGEVRVFLSFFRYHLGGKRKKLTDGLEFFFLTLDSGEKETD